MRRAILGLFIALGVLSGAPVQLEAEEATKVIGVLFVLTSRNVPWMQSFIDRMRDQGYVEGQNMRIEFRSAEGNYERLPSLAAELVALKPDVILSATLPGHRALKDLTQTIPIVMAGSPDPIKWGLIESLAHPGGNITGVTEFPGGSEFFLKQMQLLKELVPQATEIVFVWNPLLPHSSEDFKEAQRGAPAIGVNVRSLPVRDPEELRNSLDALDTPINDKTRAMLDESSALLLRYRSLIIDFAKQHRLPTMYNFREEVADGGLIAYGVDLVANYRRVATYVGKILKGAKPADLPVEQPTKYNLIINMKTAKALDLAIPLSILYSATEVIE